MQEQSRLKPLHVCYFGTYRASYTRNQIMIAGLRAQGIVVYECHAKLWRGIEDRVHQAGGGWRDPRFWWRILTVYWKLLRSHYQTPEYDVMLIGYPGQFDAFLGRLLSWWRRKPMALDILMSLHLVAEERGLTAKSPLTGRLIFLLEKAGLKLPDLLIAENSAYEAYIRQKYHLSPERFRRVPHGADDQVYYPRPVELSEDSFQVTYHGLFLPSHGLDTVVGAAELLKDHSSIHFDFFGDGPERIRIEQMSRKLGLENVHFHGFVRRSDLLDGIARSHVCLGVFGTTRQSNFTIQNKIWEGLAMQRAIVSGDSPTIREALVHREHIYLTERNDPESLAKAILELANDPALRHHLAASGYQYFLEHNTPKAIGSTMLNALSSLLQNGDND